jgi:hypothetical protein
MVMRQYLPKAGITAMPNEHINKNENMPDALLLHLKSGTQEKDLTLWGGKGFEGEPQQISLNGMHIRFSFGSRLEEVPFSLKLNRFILERYPGSNSPASFQSNITLIDNDRKYFRQDSIYMNNVLRYKGYRFYQSSYDEDEKGTYLSVNRDMPGTIVSYTGYLLLVIGFAANLLNPRSRFRWLLRQSSAVQTKWKAAATGALLLLLSFNAHSVTADSLTVDKQEAKKFGQQQPLDNISGHGRLPPSPQNTYINLTCSGENP